MMFLLATYLFGGNRIVTYAGSVASVHNRNQMRGARCFVGANGYALLAWVVFVQALEFALERRGGVLLAIDEELAHRGYGDEDLFTRENGRLGRTRLRKVHVHVSFFLLESSGDQKKDEQQKHHVNQWR